MITCKQLKLLADEMCDFLQLHIDFWPTIYTDEPHWADPSEYGSFQESGTKFEVFINLKLCLSERVSPISTLAHELSHIYVRHGLHIKYHEELLANAFERMLLRIHNLGGFN